MQKRMLGVVKGVLIGVGVACTLKVVNYGVTCFTAPSDDTKNTHLKTLSRWSWVPFGNAGRTAGRFITVRRWGRDNEIVVYQILAHSEFYALTCYNDGRKTIERYLDGKISAPIELPKNWGGIAWRPAGG